METVDIDITNATLPPANHLLRPLIDSAQPRNNIREEEIQDKMMIDEQHPGDEVMHPCSKDKPSLPSIKSLSSISSATPANMTPDDYIRHRMSDMTVSQPQRRQHVSGPSPLEPNSHQSFYESFSRRGSITDPASFHSTSRRPSIAEVLPLPNSAVQSRRGSVATDYDCPSRSPSPSAFTRQRLYDNQDSLSYSFGRRYSLSNGANTTNNGSKHPLAPPPNTGSFYDPFQRRHSIATAETSYSSTSRYGPTGGNNTSASKYKAFKFPSTIPELPTYDTLSAPPSPSQLVNTGRPEFMQDKAATSRYSHSSQLMDNHHGGPVSLSSQRRKASLIEDYRATEPYTPVRRASMPLVTVRSASSLPQLSEEEINSNGTDLLVSDRERPRKETPYSRSPALRISHKLAERKRRKEMKCLFDELRDSLPVEKNMKTSKWEILSKAVEYISLLKRRDYDLENEINELRREIDAIKRERTSNYTPPYYSS